MSGSPAAYDVLGVGAATWDSLWLVPEFSASEGVYLAEAHVGMGGGPVATALCVLAALGHTCALVDVQGDDELGRTIVADLQKHRLCTDHITVSPAATSTEAMVLVRQRDGARQIVYRPCSGGEPEWSSAAAAALRHSRLLHLNGRHENTAREAVATAEQAGVTISFDGGAGRYRPSIQDLFFASHLRIVARDFAQEATGVTDLESMMRRLLQPPALLAVITDGIRGSFIATPGAAIIHQPAHLAHPLIDTTGCGDVYHGAFLHGWLSDWAPSACAEFASRTAGLNAQGLGGRHCIAGVHRHATGDAS